MYYWDYTPFCPKWHFLQRSRPLQSQTTALLLHTMFRLQERKVWSVQQYDIVSMAKRVDIGFYAKCKKCDEMYMCCICRPEIEAFWATSWQNQQNDFCAHRRLRSAWASAQSDQSLRCALSGYLRTQFCFRRTALTLIRLGGCPGWSESSLGAQIILLVLSCRGSIFILKLQKPFRIAL